MKRFLASLLTLSALIASSGFAQELRFSGGPGQTVMIELFTSEGCSSCPPAEAYLNRFAANPGLWKTFIPLAFHVDYWDGLGWKDAYAHRTHSERQRRYARLGHLRTVYTPAFVVNGQEWRRWFGAPAPGGGNRVGMLRVRVNGERFEANFVPVASGTGALELHLALLGMGLRTDIRAGENAGRQAQHDFVVLARTQVLSNNRAWKGALPTLDRRQWETPRLALVAWVSRPGDPTPLQAAGGYLPAKP